MSKYIVNVSYAGCIQVTVEARTEARAKIDAENRCSELTDVDFLHQLDPQLMETEVVEEITNDEIL